MGAYFHIVVKLIWTQMFPPPFPSHLSYQMSIQFFPLIGGTVYSGTHLASGSPLGNALPGLDVKQTNEMQCRQRVALECLSVQSGAFDFF